MPRYFRQYTGTATSPQKQEQCSKAVNTLWSNIYGSISWYSFFIDMFSKPKENAYATASSTYFDKYSHVGGLKVSIKWESISMLYHIVLAVWQIYQIKNSDIVNGWRSMSCEWMNNNIVLFNRLCFWVIAALEKLAYWFDFVMALFYREALYQQLELISGWAKTQTTFFCFFFYFTIIITWTGDIFSSVCLVVH